MAFHLFHLECLKKLPGEPQLPTSTTKMCTTKQFEINLEKCSINLKTNGTISDKEKN